MNAFIVVALVALTPRLAFAQLPSPTNVTREVALEGGVMIAPPEIGRDVTAGGDVLVARLGPGGLLGGRFEMRYLVFGAAVNLFVGPRSINVRSTTGVEYPRHGSAPAFYAGELRLYPLGSLILGGRVTPYVAVGRGGALTSVDLDNANDQEIRHAWLRSAAAGAKVVLRRGRTFLDVQVRACRISGSGPIVPFGIQAFAIGIGTRLE